MTSNVIEKYVSQKSTLSKRGQYALLLKKAAECKAKNRVFNYGKSRCTKAKISHTASMGDDSSYPIVKYI
jgi:hypothetical protein